MWSRATLQRYLKTRQRSGRTSAGTGRQAGRGSAGGDGEAGVEARQELGQQLVGGGPIGHPGQAQLDHQPILEGAPHSLDPALGLG